MYVLRSDSLKYLFPSFQLFDVWISSYVSYHMCIFVWYVLTQDIQYTSIYTYFCLRLVVRILQTWCKWGVKTFVDLHTWLAAGSPKTKLLPRFSSKTKLCSMDHPKKTGHFVWSAGLPGSNDKSTTVVQTNQTWKVWRCFFSRANCQVGITCLRSPGQEDRPL